MHTFSDRVDSRFSRLIGTTGETQFDRLGTNMLGALLSISALSAFGGGYYGLTGASAIPLGWLKGILFPDYVFPGLIYLLVVGLSSFVASIAVFTRSKRSWILAYFAGAIPAALVITQMAIEGYNSWLQPTVLVIAAGIFVLARVLQVRGARKANGTPL